MNNEKVELEVGAPMTVTFSFNVGKLCAKRWPGAEDTYARQSNDGRVLFFDAAEEMRLRKAVRAGQPVILCREKTASGSRYLTVKTPAPELKGALAVVHGRQIPDSKYAAPEADWSGMTVESTPTPVAARSASSGPSDGGLLSRSLREAIDAAKEGQAHAAAIGFPLTFSSSDIQDLASTIYIQRCRNGSAIERMPNGRATGPVQRGASA